MATEYVLNGAKIGTLEEFFDEFNRKVPTEPCYNLDALDDVLCGGLGTPAEGFTIRWSGSAISRENLGYAETARQLEGRLERCHPTNRDEVRRKLEDARRRVGPTVFDWLVEIIHEHGPGGEEADDNVELILA